MTELHTELTRLLDGWGAGTTTDQIADLILRNRAEVLEALAGRDALVAALSKVMPLRVHDGRDYAEVYFADGVKHSTQAMTVNPQDWADIQAAYDAALARRETT